MNESRSTSNSLGASLIVSKWRPPIEAFIPIPEVSEPISSCHFEEGLPDKEMEIDQNEALIIHETTRQSASDIMENRYEPSYTEMSPLRDRALFGWIHNSDVGYFRENNNSECVMNVLFKVPKNMVYVSSYETSAYLLGMGEIDARQYERSHVLNLIEYERIIKNQPESIRHLEYQSNSLIY